MPQIVKHSRAATMNHHQPCPSCYGLFYVPPGLIGQAIGCPYCGKAVRVEPREPGIDGLLIAAVLALVLAIPLTIFVHATIGLIVSVCSFTLGIFSRVQARREKRSTIAAILVIWLNVALWLAIWVLLMLVINATLN